MAMMSPMMMKTREKTMGGVMVRLLAEADHLRFAPASYRRSIALRGQDSSVLTIEISLIVKWPNHAAGDLMQRLSWLLRDREDHASGKLMNLSPVSRPSPGIAGRWCYGPYESASFGPISAISSIPIQDSNWNTKRNSQSKCWIPKVVARL